MCEIYCRDRLAVYCQFNCWIYPEPPPKSQNTAFHLEMFVSNFQFQVYMYSKPLDWKLLLINSQKTMLLFNHR